MGDRELREKPDDVVSRVTFTPNSSALVVSSWDEKVRIVDVNGLSVRTKYMHNGPVLDVVCEVNFSTIFPSRS
jgi:WD40 repeat protein